MIIRSTKHFWNIGIIIIIILVGIFEQNSECLRAISILGDNYISLDRKDDAINLVRPLLKKHPEHAEFKMLLAQYYRLDGRLDDAVALYEEVVKAFRHLAD